VLLDSLRLWYRLVWGAADRGVLEAPFVLSRLRSEEV
jgi:hypothetical protein